MIPVTKPYLPNREKLDRYLDDIYERNWLTNNGPLVQELTKRLEDYLGVENILLVANGTLALQIAYRALGITELVDGRPAEAITTPFTFVATASSLKWEGVNPVFADIDRETWCLDPENIERRINPATRAIVPVHVFGNACDVEAIDAIAKANSLKVIYDAAHAFGVNHKGESLLKHGDAAILSFHATKLFHTGEGGAIVFKKQEDLERARRMMSFGLAGPETISDLGINAKLNELQAAMGLCVLDEIGEIFSARKSVWDMYQQRLSQKLIFQKRNPHSSNNYAYVPVLFNSESSLKEAIKRLQEEHVYPRRYFFPSLDNVEMFAGTTCAVSRNVAARILCLPIYKDVDVDRVITIISEA